MEREAEIYDDCLNPRRLRVVLILTAEDVNGLKV